METHTSLNGGVEEWRGFLSDVLVRRDSGSSQEPEVRRDNLNQMKRTSTQNRFEPNREYSSFTHTRAHTHTQADSINLALFVPHGASRGSRMSVLRGNQLTHTLRRQESSFTSLGPFPLMWS